MSPLYNFTSADAASQELTVCDEPASAETMWISMVSDLIIGMSYLAIPCMIFYFQRRLSSHFPYRWVLWLFEAFITCCGLTHFIQVVSGHPTIISMILKVMTAIVSVVTATMLIWLVPAAFAIPVHLNRLEETLAEMIRNAHQHEHGSDQLKKLRQVTQSVSALASFNSICSTAVHLVPQSSTTFSSVLIFFQPLSQHGPPEDGAASNSYLSCVAEYHSNSPQNSRSVFGALQVDPMSSVAQSILSQPNLVKLSTVDLAILIRSARFSSALAMPLKYGPHVGFIIMCSIDEAALHLPFPDMGLFFDMLTQVQIALNHSYLLEEKLRLERNLQQLRTTLKQTQSDCQEALGHVQATNDFLAATSHELRTPMNAIIGFVDVLLEDDRLVGETRESLEMVSSSANFLMNLINNILDRMKLEHTGLNFQLSMAPFSLHGCVESCLDLIGPRIEDRDICLHYIMAPKVPDVVLGDKTRITQILANLLTNAAKFCERGEIYVVISKDPIAIPNEAEYTNYRCLDFTRQRHSAQAGNRSITSNTAQPLRTQDELTSCSMPSIQNSDSALVPLLLGAAESKSSPPKSCSQNQSISHPPMASNNHSADEEEVTLYFYVVDNGQGIDDKEITHLFEKFSQSSKRPKHHGTGLGLAISAKLVELYGGKIWVKSRPNIGSIFSFSLNLRAPRQHSTANSEGISLDELCGTHALLHAPASKVDMAVILIDSHTTSFKANVTLLARMSNISYYPHKTFEAALATSTQLRQMHGDSLKIVFLVHEFTVFPHFDPMLKDCCSWCPPKESTSQPSSPSKKPTKPLSAPSKSCPTLSQDSMPPQLQQLRMLGFVAYITRRRKVNLSSLLDMGLFHFLLRAPVKRASLERVLDQVRALPAVSPAHFRPASRLSQACTPHTQPSFLDDPPLTTTLFTPGAHPEFATEPAIKARGTATPNESTTLVPPSPAEGDAPQYMIGASCPPCDDRHELAAPLDHDSAWRDQSVLVVDDNVINCKVAERVLKSLGLKSVQTANNGAEMVARWDTGERFDLIFMDIFMPDMSGLEVTRHIRDHEASHGCPFRQWICAMTASALPDERDACKAAGMDDFVSKPIKRDTIIAALHKAAVFKHANVAASASGAAATHTPKPSPPA